MRGCEPEHTPGIRCVFHQLASQRLTSWDQRGALFGSDAVLRDLIVIPRGHPATECMSNQPRARDAVDIGSEREEVFVDETVGSRQVHQRAESALDMR